MQGRIKICESTETYLKTILILQKKLGNVRSVDVANELNISKPSVSNAVKKLCNEGFVLMDLNRNLLLTPDGFKYAAFVFECHQVIEKFLTDILGIDEEAAHRDACRLEHFISSETSRKLEEFCHKNTQGENEIDKSI